MSRYEDLYERVRAAGWAEELTPVPERQIARFREEYPGLPEDYLDYLREVGEGMLGRESYMVYEGPLSPEEVYEPEQAGEVEGIVLFGDDLNGYCTGFSPAENWAVVEIEPLDMSARRLAGTFEEFIRKKIAKLLKIHGGK